MALQTSDIGKKGYPPDFSKEQTDAVSWGDVRLVLTNGVSHGEVENKLVASFSVAEFDIYDYYLLRLKQMRIFKN